MTLDELKNNLQQNCIPFDIVKWDYNNYLDKFLIERRKLMSKKIEEYYKKYSILNFNVDY